MQKRLIMTDERVLSSEKKLIQLEEKTNKNLSMVLEKMESTQVNIQNLIENNNRQLKEYIDTAISQAVQEMKVAINESAQQNFARPKMNY